SFHVLAFSVPTRPQLACSLLYVQSSKRSGCASTASTGTKNQDAKCFSLASPLGRQSDPAAVGLPAGCCFFLLHAKPPAREHVMFGRQVPPTHWLARSCFCSCGSQSRPRLAVPCRKECGISLRNHRVTTCSSNLNVELDALRQRQVVGIVDSAG